MENPRIKSGIQILERFKWLDLLNSFVQRFYILRRVPVSNKSTDRTGTRRQQQATDRSRPGTIRRHPSRPRNAENSTRSIPRNDPPVSKLLLPARVRESHGKNRHGFITTRYQHSRIHYTVEGFMGQTLTRMTTRTMVTWAGHNAGCGLTSDTSGSRPIPVYPWAKV